MEPWFAALQSSDGEGNQEHLSSARAAALPRPEILDACCGGRHWWWDKAHPLAVYMDERELAPGAVDVRPNFEVAPDVIGDFRAMPFAAGTFQLVLFDPPHIVREKPSTSYIRLKYGALRPATEQHDLRRGFAECWRVLAPGGTLVFKWGAESIKRVEPHFPAQPIVGTRSPRGGQTRWFIFYKPLPTAEEEVSEQVGTGLRSEGAADASRRRRNLLRPAHLLSHRRPEIERLIAEARGEQEWLLKQKQHHIEVRERLKWIGRFLRLAQQYKCDLLSLELLDHLVERTNPGAANSQGPSS